MKIRIFVLFLGSALAGCLNFGTVSNKIDKIEGNATVSNSAVVKVEGATPSDTASNSASPSASPTLAPTPTPTPIPAGRLFVNVDRNAVGIERIGPRERNYILFFVYLSASSDRDQIVNMLRISQIGTAVLERSVLSNLRLEVEREPVASLPNLIKTAEFSKPEGLFVVPRGRTVAVGVRANTDVPSDLHEKPYGLSIASTSDIQTLSSAQITGAFPADGPLIYLCFNTDNCRTP